MVENIKVKNIIFNIIGGLILAFGLYNIHAISNITEGGFLGLTLLLQHWFNLSPSITGFIFSVICYFIGWKTLEKGFILYSFFAAGSFSLFYWIFEFFPPVYPQISTMPLLACIIGAIFVGVSVGICVKYGGAPTGDDALAMSISKKFKLDIKWSYLASDLIVLLLSLTYIKVNIIIYSLITVILSGQIIGLIVNKKNIEEK